MAPGMVRRKVRSTPASAARRATCASSAAAPAVTRVPSTSMPLKPRPSRITTPRMPPSRTIRFDPTPIGKTGTRGGSAARNAGQIQVRSSRAGTASPPARRPAARSDRASGRSGVSVPRTRRSGEERGEPPPRPVLVGDDSPEAGCPPRSGPRPAASGCGATAASRSRRPSRPRGRRGRARPSSAARPAATARGGADRRSRTRWPGPVIGRAPPASRPRSSARHGQAMQPTTASTAMTTNISRTAMLPKALLCSETAVRSIWMTLRAPSPRATSGIAQPRPVRRVRTRLKAEKGRSANR
jgi:hypothetical protein